MTKYTNQQLTSTEVIAALVEFAKGVAAEASRGAKFIPPLDDGLLAFYDAVAQNESAVQEQGTGVEQMESMAPRFDAHDAGQV